MERYIHTFLDLAVSMHGSEVHANSTTTDVLNSEKNRLENELGSANQQVQDLHQSLLNVTTQLENSQTLANDRASEITDLKKTIDGLKGSLNLARNETRAIMEDNAKLKIQLLNAGSNENPSTSSNQNQNQSDGNASVRDDTAARTRQYSDVSEDGEDDLVYMGMDAACQSADNKRTSKTDKGGPFKRSRPS